MMMMITIIVVIIIILMASAENGTEYKQQRYSEQLELVGIESFRTGRSAY